MTDVRRDPPQSSGRSLPLIAACSGAGAALVGAVVSIAAVAVCWLPAAGHAGSAGAAIRAGVLTFLAALHGGITVDGLPAHFVPLGMTIIVAAIAWRAGSRLAAAAQDVGADAPRALVQSFSVQAAAFSATCGIGAALSPLGTSSVSVPGAAFAALVLFALAGGTAFVRSSPLADEVADRAPGWSAPVLRAAAAGIAAYLGAGAVLVAGSLVLHSGRVETLSRQVGGGWSGVPILLLGILAAPNAVIAGASYLAGPGFALGNGSGVSLGSTVHGTFPAFPVLGAVPSGPATSAGWLLAAATPVVAGLSVAKVVSTAPSWTVRLQHAAAAAGVAVLLGGVLAWQGGGAIGAGRLRTVGASPWQFGLATGAGLAVVAGTSIGALTLLGWWRARADDPAGSPRATLAAVGPAAGRSSTDDADEEGKLAG